MGNGQWAMGNGQWAMGNGQWAMLEKINCKVCIFAPLEHKVGRTSCNVFNKSRRDDRCFRKHNLSRVGHSLRVAHPAKRIKEASNKVDEKNKNFVTLNKDLLYKSATPLKIIKEKMLVSKK